MPPSRRALLRATGALAVGTATASAGCLTFGSSRGFVLHTDDVDGGLASPFLVDDPTAVRAETRIDYDTETKREWVGELFETGSVTAVQWPLVEPDAWGDDVRPRPTYLHRDDAYHEVTTESTRDVERDRWLFAVERTDEDPPSDATVGRDPFDSLSDRDREVLQAALDAVYAGNDGFLGEPDIDGLRPVEYHRDVSVEESDLVPEPPFEYVEYSEDTYRVVTEQRTVTVPERTFAVERVASTRDELESYVHDTVPDARFEDPSDAAREVLDAAVDDEEHQRYEEEPPLSEGLSTVVDALGIGDDLRPFEAYEERVDFRFAVASYDGDWYLFNLYVDP
ncbi:hypothetical protein G9C85_09175 [Halorubellus sp. JP-L1]|uniref:hypothetical protein n=1 Tax=Halorubellus sp. JP-L1 TaxID=2715753 RepID=UPI001408736B|nr:hypothetical protein [Halorubellus sp. JP-L1]NHN41799.1 hypothetical protein [Halorubellus sp. JP-L1]